MKNGRPKLPRVFLMLLTLITSVGSCSFIVLAVFMSAGVQEESPGPFYDLISNDTPFLAGEKFPGHILFRACTIKENANIRIRQHREVDS